MEENPIETTTYEIPSQAYPPEGIKTREQAFLYFSNTNFFQKYGDNLRLNPESGGGCPDLQQGV